jgi:hypothetical protein
MSIQRLLTKNGVLDTAFIPDGLLPADVNGPVYGQSNPIDLSTQQVGFNLSYEYPPFGENLKIYPITATPKTYAVFPNGINLPAGVFLVWGSIGFTTSAIEANLEILEAEILLASSPSLTDNSVAWNSEATNTPAEAVLALPPKIFNTTGLDKLNIVLKIQNTASTLSLRSNIKLIRIA